MTTKNAKAAPIRKQMVERMTNGRERDRSDECSPGEMNDQSWYRVRGRDIITPARKATFNWVKKASVGAIIKSFD
jgi:hypothetical protein